MSTPEPHVPAERGSALLFGWVGVATTVLALVLVVDLTAYLAAASRAQGAADAAALAAVAVSHPQGNASGVPVVVAERVAREWGGTLVACSCRPGARVVRVTVAVPVRALVVTRFAARQVAATASATMVPAQLPSDAKDS